MPTLSLVDWQLATLAALLTGFTKTGFPGLGMIIVPLLATVFPARQSVGVLLPMLIAADVFGVLCYRRHAVLKHLFALLPWVLGGLLIGYRVLARIDNQAMRPLLGLLILGLAVLHLLRERFARWLQNRDAREHLSWLVAGTGLAAGIATMVANAAGSIMSLHLLARKLPKHVFMGTGAWFYLCINLIKVPLLLNLGLITTESLRFNLWMLPAIVIGALAGIALLPRIPQRLFERAMLTLAVLAALRLLIH